MTGGPDRAILTLEPLIDAVRAGVEGTGWSLSGLQKTTSHQFEGRWEGESTRSAYLFFHCDARGAAELSSIDVYLDETSRGLTGNLALVVDLIPLARLGDPSDVLTRLAALSCGALGAPPRRPLTLRLRLPDSGTATAEADVEVRFKVSIPRAAIGEGWSAVEQLARTAVNAFETILSTPDLSELVEHE